MCRGRRLQRQRRLAHHFDGHRRIVVDDRPVHGRVDIDRALNDVKDQIAKIRTDLPRTIDAAAHHQPRRYRGLADRHLSGFAPGLSVEQLSWFVDDTVARDLQSLRGVGEVKRFGGVDQARSGSRLIRRNYSPRRDRGDGQRARCAPITSISAAAAARVAGQEQAIRTLAWRARALAIWRRCRSPRQAGGRSGLDELATITDGAAEPRTFTRLFDEPIVAFASPRQGRERRHGRSADQQRLARD